MPAIDYALSLGPNCRAKYHLRRRFGFGSPNCVFDWQVTPPAALQAYIEQDFNGMYERDDLYIKNGCVFNRRYNTSHQHEFPRGTTEQTLSEHYPAARARHDYLYQRTRSLLRGHARLLLAFSRPISDDTSQSLRKTLRGYSPHLRFEWLQEPEGGADGNDWTGNSAVWDALLAPYSLGVVQKARVVLRSTPGRLLRAGKTFGRQWLPRP